MPTTKRRIQISLSKEAEEQLEHFADRDNTPIAQKVTQYMQAGMELEEDMVFTKIATERLKNRSETISHEDAWGNL